MCGTWEDFLKEVTEVMESNLYKMILNQLSEKGKDCEQKTCDEEVESILETLKKGTGGSELKMCLKMSEDKRTGAW